MGIFIICMKKSVVGGDVMINNIEVLENIPFYYWFLAGALSVIFYSYAYRLVDYITLNYTK